MEEEKREILTENLKVKELEKEQEKAEKEVIQEEALVAKELQEETPEENTIQEEEAQEKIISEETEKIEVSKKEKKFERIDSKKKEISKHMKEMEEKPNKTNKRKKIIIASIIGVIIIIALFFSTIFALININNNKIIKGISIEGIDMSGLTKEEAKSKLEDIYNKKKETQIKIKHKEYESTISPILLEVNYDIDKAIEEADKIGKSENIFINNYNILFALISNKDIEVEMTINEDIAKQNIEDMNVNIPDGVIESSYSVDDDELTITKGKAGVKINSEEFLKQIKEKLQDIKITDITMEIPVANANPEPINIEKIHEEICKEPQDAYFTKEPFAVYPEVNGISFDLEEAKKILEEEKETYIIKLTITKPKITLDKIGPEAFPEKLATFSTRYDVSDKDRTTNLELASGKINGTVVLSGDVFSYNKTVGARTAGAGYKNAKIYESGKVVDGLGGGICQISSTLYNAVLLANLEIVERRNHQFTTSYVEPGKDATVVYGSTDFKFKNTRKYPIRLVATAKNGIATVSVYGIKEETEYTFKFDVKKIATIPYKTEYIDDNTLPTGTEQVIQKGANGLKTETYIIKMLNGKTVSTKLLSKDTYSAMTRIVKRGTGPAKVTPNMSNTEQNPNTQTPEETKPQEQENVNKPTQEN